MQLKDVKQLKKQAPALESVTIPGLSDKQKPAKTKGKILKSIFNFLKPETAYAQSATPLMAYREGLEKRTMDFILYYLTEHQNDDGSFGPFSKYELTADTFFLLAQYRKTANYNFENAVNYLLTTEPKNYREKAIKARALAGTGQL